MDASKLSSHTIFGMPKLPPRFGAIVMPLLLSVFMTFIVSMVSTLRSIGPAPDFIQVWLGAWAISWVVAFPTLLLILPIVRRATAAVVRVA